MTPTPVGMRCPECSRQRTKVRTLRSTVHRPQVTYALIVVNVIVFLTEGQFGVYSSSGLGGSVVAEGELSRSGVEAGQYWRLVTGGFLHASVLHIAFNMYLLYLLGTMLEPAIGSARFAAIYFTSLLAGSFGALFATAAPTIGASGAIFGLMGAAAVELRARRISLWASGIGGLIVLNLALSFTVTGISVGGHIGGLVGGTLAALAIRAADDGRIPGVRGRVPALGFVACLLLSAAAVAGSLAVAGSTSPGIA
jgi:membrane associated rhomboid family serine protease